MLRKQTDKTTQKDLKEYLTIAYIRKTVLREKGNKSHL